MPHSDKMGNNVRGFPANMGWYGGGGEGFGGEGESLWCVFEWKYCNSLSKLKCVFP